MITSMRISNELTHKSLQLLIEAGYHDLKTLKTTTWEKRLLQWEARQDLS